MLAGIHATDVGPKNITDGYDAIKIMRYDK